MFKQKSFKTAEVSIIMTLPEVNEAAKGAGGRPVFHIFGMFWTPCSYWH